MKSRRNINQQSIWVSLASLVAVLVFWCFAKQNTSPGEIAMVHHQQSSLAGSEGCGSCHGNRSRSMKESCQACHEEIGKQLSARTGFHGLMPSEVVGNCPKCHTEHHGRDFPIINQQSFALAGIADPSSFDHAGLGFYLEGKHLGIACGECHPFADADVLQEGQKRFLGLDQRCTSCHKDPHRETHFQACDSCHGQSQPFNAVAEFRHTSAFPLDGAHATAACQDCHPPETGWSVNLMLQRHRASGESPQIVSTCRECHFSPHSESFLVAVAVATNSSPQRSCRHCHPATDGSFAGNAESMAGARHTVSGFPLAPPHDTAPCDACHEGFGKPKKSAESFRRAYPGRDPDHCAACHGDPHQGQFAGGPFGSEGCLACHVRDRFRPSLFSVEQHQNTRFPLSGAHRNVDCNACHWVPVRPSGGRPLPSTARIFHGTPTTCVACHGDSHGGQFEQGPFRGGDCLVCHYDTTFLPSSFTTEQHARTQFPLTGAHAAVGCDNCHSLTEECIGTNGRRFRMRVFHDTPSACVACHEDVHAGRFDRPGLPVTVEGRQGCARCHLTERFDVVRLENFDHGRWTGYELVAAHARAKCEGCHGKHDLIDLLGGALRTVIDTRCQACHQDPHVGQFGPTAEVDCARCHVLGDSFRDLAFDHQLDSRFPLDDVHVRLACSTCHLPQQVPGWGTAIRYKPLGVVCGDCHDPGYRDRRPRGRQR